MESNGLTYINKSDEHSDFRKGFIVIIGPKDTMNDPYATTHLMENIEILFYYKLSKKIYGRCNLIIDLIK